MSKINIPTCILPEKECEVFFKSVVDKLNIQNPSFHYPIYNKIIDNASESRGLIFDSKFKVREILSKVLDTDSDDYETDEDTYSSGGGDDCSILDKSYYTFNLEVSNKQESISHDISVLEEDNSLEEVLNTDKDVELSKAINPESDILDNNASDESSNDDREIDDAISNVFSATAKIERINKATGEKTIKEEQIHIKKESATRTFKNS